jgi:hypothetical protein
MSRRSRPQSRRQSNYRRTKSHALISKRKERLLTLTVLAKGTPYTPDYLRILVNRHMIDATKQGKTWLTTKKIVNSYVKQH